jgi:uncharacterized membrane protein YkvA (DUF1232 family)
MGMTRHSSKTPWGAILSLFAALLYGASPIDLIPDLIPLIGWVDDAVIVPVLLVLALVQWRRAKRAKVSRTVIPRNP